MKTRKEAQPDVQLVSADTLEGEKVVDAHGEDLGTIEDLMIDVQRGTIACAVMSCTFPDGGDQLVAVPWIALRRDDQRQCFVLDAERESLAQDRRFTYR